MTEIPNPYISLLVPPLPREAPLPIGVTITALIEKALPDGRYQMNLRGFMLEATLPYLLQPQDRVNVFIRDVSPSGIQMEVSPIKAEVPTRIEDARVDDLIKEMNLPRRKDAVELVREFLRQRAPIDHDTLATALETARGEVTRQQAAAFASSRGVEPTENAVTQLARIPAPAPESAEAPPPSNPVLEAVSNVVRQSDPKDSPQAVLDKNFSRSPIPEVDQAVRHVLISHPRLRAIDHALSMVEHSVATKEIPTPIDVARRVATLVKQVLEGTPLPNALREPAEVLRQLKFELLKKEGIEIQREPILLEARQQGQSLFDALERVQGMRMANQLFQVHDEGTAIMEIPIEHNGKKEKIPVRLARRRSGGKKGRGGTTLLTIHTDLSRLGRVEARLEARKKTLTIQFAVRDKEIRDHLDRGTAELQAALKNIGFESTIRVGVGTPPDDPLPFPTAGEFSYTMVDMRA